MDEKTMSDMSASAMIRTDGITADALKSIDKMIKNAASHAESPVCGPSQAGEITAESLVARDGTNGGDCGLLKGSVCYNGEYVAVRRVVGQNG